MALKSPYSLVLTARTAQLLFPSGNVVGQAVEVENFGTYTVTGILEQPKGKSHIQFNALASFSTLPLLRNDQKINENYDNWKNLWVNYNYLVLTNPDQAKQAEQSINELASLNMEFEEDHPGYEFELQAMNEIVPGRLLSNEISFSLPGIALLFFGILGLIVIITASINYTNLSIALSLTRIKEVGIRRTNGATSAQIIVQFLIEALLIASLALIMAIGIYKVLIDQFNSLWIFNQIGITLRDTAFAYLVFLGFTILLGIFTGLGPALFVSRMDTIRSLKGNLFTSQKRAGLFRLLSGKRIMMGVQFSLSLIMLVSIYLLREQANLLTSSQYGFEKEHIYYIDIQGHDPNVIDSEFGNIPGIEQVAFTTHHPATGHSYGDGYRLDPEDEFKTIYHFSVDKNYTSVMGLKLIAGSDFNQSSSGKDGVIINELAVKRMGFESPTGAIGQIILNNENRGLKIIGVVEDYHWEPLMKSIRPLMLKQHEGEYHFAYLRIAANEPIDQKVKEKWAKFDDSRDFKGGYLDDTIREFYQFMYDLGGILTYVAMIAVVITLLGFIGMVSYHLKTRVKEIGIRKVLGANFRSLTISMGRSFLLMLVLTVIISTPLAIFINGLWINQMEVHAPISLLNVGPAVLTILVLSLLTIVIQVWKSASSNPVDAIRND